nr:transketolase C-terminal domain-containing protein [Candidatus Sigynarchaeum springense]MDO8115922.1 transketolase C-terminal domain-containing protein [Candidatus Sigynarchaeota archaeon]
MIDEEKRYIPPGKYVLMGNVAMAEGAMAAGLTFFGGYPITPSTEVPEHLVSRLPEAGGAFIQMEDELAAINAVAGASVAGAKAMTASSGPGTSLMGETISMAAALEIPLVICDVQRNGPGTGLVTAPHHNDVFQCKYSGNGEYEVIAYAPMSCQELYDLTIEAFNAAETYRCPTYIMSDAYLGHLHEQVIIPPANEIKKRVIARQVVFDKPNPEKFTFADSQGNVKIPPPPVLGTSNFPTMLFSQPHGPDGIPVNEDQVLKPITLLTEKITKNIEKIAKTEAYMLDDAEIVLVAYGLTARVCYHVVNAARKQGIKVGLFRLVTIWPFPYERVKKAIASARAVVVPEMNLGLMAGEVERCKPLSTPLYKVPKIADIHEPGEILAAVKKANEEAQA